MLKPRIGLGLPETRREGALWLRGENPSLEPGAHVSATQVLSIKCGQPVFVEIMKLLKVCVYTFPKMYLESEELPCPCRHPS